jgi:diketogulonate reductase-like aldo/keto reductase
MKGEDRILNTRREFLKQAGIATSAMTLPWSVVANAQQQLPRRAIPGTDETLPIVGLGTGGVFFEGDVGASRVLMEILRARGGSYMDCLYGARTTVAQVINDLNAPDDFFMGAYVMGKTDEESRAAIAQLLELSGKDSLDLIHAWNEFAVPNWDLIRGWKDDGLARYIGVSRNASTHYEDIIKLMNTGDVDIVQVNYSALEPEAEEVILPMAMDMGIAVNINRPFLNGDYFPLVSGHELPEWAAEFDCETWAQFSLKHILSHPAVNCVITDTTSPDHAVDNIEAGFGRMPDESQRKQIAAHLKELSA